MKSKRIFLIRHAQSAGNINRSLYKSVPDWKIELSDDGHKQASELGDRLSEELKNYGSVAVYTSPYKRTLQTWENILEKFKENRIIVQSVKEDPRLREQEWGNLREFDGKTLEEVETERDAYGSFFYRFSHGESGADVYDRCTGFLSTLYRDFTKDNMPENVIIVTHGYTLRVLLMRWLHWSVHNFDTLKNPKNAEFFQLQFQEDTKKYQLIEQFPKYEISNT